MAKGKNKHVNKGARKVVGYNSSDKNVYNSIGDLYVEDTNHSLTFQKDEEKLLAQYSNLINSLGRKYASFCKTAQDREDLFSYIKECFITLVREYSMTNTYDFAGYIKRMLPMRVRGSYINKMRRHDKRESTLKGLDSSVESVIDAKSMISNDTSEVTIRKRPNKDEYTAYIVTHRTLPEIDDTIMELKDELKTNPYYSDVTSKLVDYLAVGITPEDAISRVANDYNIDISKVRDNFFMLKDTLKDMFNY